MNQYHKHPPHIGKTAKKVTMNLESIGIVQLGAIRTVSAKDVHCSIGDCTGMSVTTSGQVSRCRDRGPCEGARVEAPDIVVEVVGVCSSENVNLAIMNTRTVT